MTAITITIDLLSASATMALGEYLGQLLPLEQVIIYLNGDLGAGKTTLVRGFLHGKGYVGKVKSPTYSLIESYLELSHPVHHLDLYRLKTPAELETLGLRDYLADNSTLLIEWPEQAAGFLPAANIQIAIEHQGDGRKVILQAIDLFGQTILAKFSATKLQKILL